MPLYLCKCKNCAFLTIPTTDTDIAKMAMLSHRHKSHKEDFEFSHRVSLNDLRELFTINAVREAGEVAHYLAVKPWLRKSFWKAQRVSSIEIANNLQVAGVLVNHIGET